MEILCCGCKVIFKACCGCNIWWPIAVLGIVIAVVVCITLCVKFKFHMELDYFKILREEEEKRKDTKSL